MTKLYELPNGRRFITDIDESTRICNVTEPQLNILISDLNSYAEMCEHAILFSEDATNGDMVMAMFPNCKDWKAKIEDNDEEVYEVHFVQLPNSMTVNRYEESWWNAPYKRESEE